jgi:hypothetical protein
VEMDMFGGLTKTSSRIAIAAALGMTLGGFAMGATPAKAADLGGDCCADLEERVAELEATTVRKGNKKVSVTLSGWVVKLGSWWDDGHEKNFYVGDKDTTLSSHFQISGSAVIAPGWSGGYTIAVETAGTSCSVGFVENQFNDNACLFGDINTLLSYMWLKSDKYGTINWGQLSQATDNVALLPDLSGTVIESNAVLFDGAGMFIRPQGARNSNDLATDFAWLQVTRCLGKGGGVGADCAGYPYNGFRYDSPTWAGFSASGGYYEDDVWDIAVKYAADWNSIKVSAAAGYTQSTDEGCNGTLLTSPDFNGKTPPNPRTNCGNGVQNGGGGAPFQGFKQDDKLFQVGASILHVPSGLFVYGLYQREEEDGTQFKALAFSNGKSRIVNSDANETDVWFVKAGIKRAWLPAGATVIWGEGGQYQDQFNGLCGNSGGGGFGDDGNTCNVLLTTGINKDGTGIFTNTSVTSSEVNRWGVGVVQEIDSAAMHLFARWQHLELNLSGVQAFTDAEGNSFTNGKRVNFNGQDLDIFQVGGVIFF